MSAVAETSARSRTWAFGDGPEVHWRIREAGVGATVEDVARPLTDGARQALRTLLELAAVCRGEERMVRNITHYTEFYLNLEELASRMDAAPCVPRAQIAQQFFAEQFAEHLERTAGRDLASEDGTSVRANVKAGWAAASTELCADYARANAAPLCVLLTDYEDARRAAAADGRPCAMFPMARFDIVHATAPKAEEPHADPIMRRALRVNGLDGDDTVSGTYLWPFRNVCSPYVKGNTLGWFFRVKNGREGSAELVTAGRVMMLNGTQAANFGLTEWTLTEFPNAQPPGLTLGVHQSGTAVLHHAPETARVASRLSSLRDNARSRLLYAQWKDQTHLAA